MVGKHRDEGEILAIDREILDQVQPDPLQPRRLLIGEVATFDDLVAWPRRRAPGAVSSGAVSSAACLTIEMMSTRAFW